MSDRNETYTFGESPAQAHCSLCGAIDNGDSREGYSACCSETICPGGGCVMMRSEWDAWQRNYYPEPSTRVRKSDVVHYSSRAEAQSYIDEDQESDSEW